MLKLLKMAFKVEDFFKKSWLVKDRLASGGFGTIYDCLLCDQTEPSAIKKHVIKFEKETSKAARTECFIYSIINEDPYKRSDFIKMRSLSHLALTNMVSYGFNSPDRFIILTKYHYNLKSYSKIYDMPKRRVFKLAFHILNALEFLHTCGYIHRDIKDANIVFDNIDYPYLIDFGLASSVNVHRTSTNSNSFVGTLKYCSIDAHHGNCTYRSDIESLLYCIFFWLKGKVPWADTKMPKYVAFKKNNCRNSRYRAIADSIGLTARRRIFIKLITYISDLKSEEHPNYAVLRAWLLRLSVRDEIFRSKSGSS